MVLSIDGGDQTPTIPLGEVLFNTGAVFPKHSVKAVGKLGTIFGFEMLTVVVKLVAH